MNNTDPKSNLTLKEIKMPQLPSVFTKQDAEPMMTFTILPEGWYEAKAVKSELKPTKAGNGKRLIFTFKVISGKYSGSNVFAGLNIDNPSHQAVSIAMRELRSIIDACGIEELSSSEEVHGIPIWIRVVIDPPNNGFGEKNSIKEYRALSDVPECVEDCDPF